MNTDLKIERERVVAFAVDIFSDPEVAGDWLKSPNIVLNGRKPIDLMETLDGVRKFQTILGRIAYGVYS